MWRPVAAWDGCGNTVQDLCAFFSNQEMFAIKSCAQRSWAFNIHCVLCRYEITESANDALLVVHDAEKCDMGDYTVRVENSLNTDTATFHIAITGN